MTMPQERDWTALLGRIAQADQAALAEFYGDLRDPLCESQVAVFHQRYSTNTMPDWRLAQPFRLLAHNGEINTLSGNEAWMRAREAELPDELRPAFVERMVERTSPLTLDYVRLNIDARRPV